MPLKVLIVDDASFVRDTIKRTLRQFIPNVEIHDAADGRRAVSAMKMNKFDIVLSDWEMPEMTGEEFLCWVRRDSNNPTVPFIMISSRGDRDHIIKAIQSGVSDYLSKPFTAEELRKKIAKQLKKIGHKDSRAQPQTASGFSSLDVLTSSSVNRVASGPPEVKSASLFAKPAAVVATSKNDGIQFQGKAQLRFPHLTCECAIRDLSLQAMSGFMMRPENLPTVFDQAVVDLEDKHGSAMARLNGYVHSIQAVENNPNTTKLKIVVRFVDNDPDKFEAISKAIAH
ncbi:response regulator [Teredinibacter franksiae]|uniref:response regulator n=1 Tax=Teredinibacter franksiae TaxID=2761453 RepID=UPI00162501DD|nr:response regulator [Teredinibacter franksiae]